MSDTPKDLHVPKGLEDVVVGTSSITFLDGLKGRMLYKGYDAVAMAGQVSFEEIVYLLWEGDLPTRAQLQPFSKSLADNRALPAEVLAVMEKFPKHCHPMDVLREGVTLLAMVASDAHDGSQKDNREKALRLVARMGTFAAAWDRIRKGLPVIPPDPTLSHSANFIYMVTGKKPDPLSVEAMDMYLSLLADHDLNASTFTARVIISTLSDMHSAIAGALGALKGPLHGGANEKAMEMFLEIGDPAQVDSWVEKALQEKRKIMGFGHRVYKVEDPRSVPLRAMAHRLSVEKGDTRWYNISIKVAEAVQRHKNIYTNVDFYSASVLYLLGIPIDLFTTVFAAGRVAGWCAHVFEQLADNRLIRPRTDYTGPTDRVFKPLAQR
ncbi:MAG: citrate synthase [Elusimicrobia bacterium]|nr:citrate synthase [Elusimicrobiota bacterium]MBP9127812.1 citrate synthase [Elusimicrobiota bacterium]